MSRPQNSFSSLPKPKKQAIRAPKVKNDPKIKSISKVRIEGTIENKSFSTKRVDPKTAFEPYHSPKDGLLEPQKVKKDPKFKPK